MTGGPRGHEHPVELSTAEAGQAAEPAPAVSARAAGPWWAAATLVLLPLLVIGVVLTRAAGEAGDGPPTAGAASEGLGVTGHFFLAAAVVLALSHLGGAVAHRLGQPRVIGEICAGLLLGPTLFGRIAPDAATWLFPPQALPMLNGLAQLGLVLFMFGVGRELAAMPLRAASSQAVLVSLSSLLLPCAAGTAAALLIPHHFIGDRGNPLSFVLFLGCALSITAFPVLARILTDLGLTRTRHGQLSLFAAAVGDAGSWLLLTAILASVQGAGHMRLLFDIGVLVAAVALILGPVRRLLARRPDDTGDGSGRAAGVPASGTVALLLAVGVTATAALTSAVGVHQLIGGLLVGLAWPDRHRSTHVIAERTTALAKAVLLPFFFFGFGLTIDLGILSRDRSTLLTFAALLLCAVASKVLGPGLCARLTGLDGPTSLALGILLNARGLTELVVIQVGHQAGIIDERMAGILTLVALITTLMTSPALRLLDRRERSRQNRRTATGRRSGLSGSLPVTSMDRPGPEQNRANGSR